MSGVPGHAQVARRARAIHPPLSAPAAATTAAAASQA